MTDLVKKDTLTSLELVREINVFRQEEGNRSELKHSDLLKIIRDEFEEEINGGKISCVEYKDAKGEMRPMFILTLSQAKQVLVRESKFVRKAVIAYIEKLENALKQKFQVPTTFAEALRLAAEQQEQIEQQQKLIEVQKPKAEFYDDVVESKDALPMDMVAKTLNAGLGRNKLFAFLRDKGVLMRNNTPFQRYVGLGWFRCIETKFNKPNGDTCINIKTVVLQKGLDGIRKMLKERNKGGSQSKKKCGEIR